MYALISPRGVVLAKHLKPRLVGGYIYHNYVVYRIGNELGIVVVCVIVITIVREL